jgi:hypothetical protein
MSVRDSFFGNSLACADAALNCQAADTNPKPRHRSLAICRYVRWNTSTTDASSIGCGGSLDYLSGRRHGLTKTINILGNVWAKPMLGA